MTEKKVVTIFGATGAQGGGLAHAILDDSNSEFEVRAVTRDAGSDKAKALADKGAEDLGNMFQFYRDFEEYFQSARDVKISRELNPELKTFDHWLKANTSKIPLE